MFKFSTIPLSPVQLLTEALKLYVQSFKKLFWIFLGYFVISAYYSSGYLLNIFPLDINKMQHLSGWVLAYYVGITIVSLIILYFKAVTMHSMQQQAESNKKVSLRQSCSLVIRKYWPILLAQMLISCLTIIGLLAFILPGIFIGIALTFSLPLILFNNQNIIQAIKGSFMLVWGKWWHVVTTIALPMVIMMCIDVYLPNLMVKVLWKDVVGILLLIINTFAIFPILISTILVLFNDVKIAK